MITTRAELFAEIDRMDAHAWAAHLAPGVVLRFANTDPIHGREGCERALSWMLGRLETITHDKLDEWRHGDTTIVEATVTIRRTGGTPITLPMVTIFRENLRHQISDYRIYVDPAPVLG